MQQLDDYSVDLFASSARRKIMKFSGEYHLEDNFSRKPAHSLGMLLQKCCSRDKVIEVFSWWRVPRGRLSGIFPYRTLFRWYGLDVDASSFRRIFLPAVLFPIVERVHDASLEVLLFRCGGGRRLHNKRVLLIRCGNVYETCRGFLLSDLTEATLTRNIERR